MRFTYPARLRPDSSGELIVSFRDLPECLTSGTSEADALAEAAGALEEAIAGRIDDAERIPYRAHDALENIMSPSPPAPQPRPHSSSRFAKAVCPA